MRTAAREIGTFNRVCRVAVFVWLVVAVPLSFQIRPVRFDDFAQYYMGGVIARQSAWDSLYPIPHPDSPYNPGLRRDSEQRPMYAALAERAGVGNDVRFIQPPPDALLFAPLARLPYHQAFWIWVGINCLCAWGVALLAGKFYELSAGGPSRISGAVTLLAGFSLLSYKTIRALNIEMPLTLLLGLATLQLLRGDRVRGAAALVLGGFLKYAALILLPLAVALRRWKTLAWTLLLIGAILGISYWVMGGGPFREYIHMLPLLSRPYEDAENQSLTGLLLRLTDRIPPLPGNLTFCVRAAGALTFIGLCALILRRFWHVNRPAPAAVFAAAAALTGWMLVFSPLAWDKYYVFLNPFWGWLAWEAKSSKWRMVVVVLAILAWTAPFQWLGEMREPLNSRMLWGTMGMLVIAVMRLIRAEPQPLDASE